MNFKRTSVALGVAALAALAAPVAMAQDSGWYAGASAGRSAATVDDDRIRAGLLGQGLGTASIDDRDHNTGYKLFGGYQFGRNLGLEMGYFDLGHFGYTAHTVPPGTLDGDIKLRGLNLDLVGTLPLGEKLSVLGRAGVTSARASDSFSGPLRSGPTVSKLVPILTV